MSSAEQVQGSTAVSGEVSQSSPGTTARLNTGEVPQPAVPTDSSVSPSKQESDSVSGQYQKKLSISSASDAKPVHERPGPELAPQSVDIPARQPPPAVQPMPLEESALPTQTASQNAAKQVASVALSQTSQAPPAVVPAHAPPTHAPSAHAVACSPQSSSQPSEKPNAGANSSNGVSSKAPERQEVCSNCGATETPLWRRGMRGEIVCNACGLYLKARHFSRPVNLKRPPRTKTVDPASSSEACGSCPGDGRCNGTGGSSSCSDCPAFNNRNKQPTKSSSQVKSDDEAAQTLISCTNCGTVNTPMWRRDPDGNIICNACGLYFRLHNHFRPTDMTTGVIKRRKRTLDAGDETHDTSVEGEEPKKKMTASMNAMSLQPTAQSLVALSQSVPTSSAMSRNSTPQPPVSNSSTNGSANHNQSHNQSGQASQPSQPGQQHQAHPPAQRQGVPSAPNQAQRPDHPMMVMPGQPVFPFHYQHMMPMMPMQGNPTPIDFTHSFKPVVEPVDYYQSPGCVEPSHAPQPMMVPLRGPPQPQPRMPSITSQHHTPQLQPQPQPQPQPQAKPQPSTGEPLGSKSSASTPAGTPGKAASPPHPALPDPAPKFRSMGESPLLVLKYLQGDSAKEYLLAVRRHLQDKVEQCKATLAESEQYLQDCEEHLQKINHP